MPYTKWVPSLYPSFTNNAGTTKTAPDVGFQPSISFPSELSFSVLQVQVDCVTPLRKTFSSPSTLPDWPWGPSIVPQPLDQVSFHSPLCGPCWSPTGLLCVPQTSWLHPASIPLALLLRKRRISPFLLKSWPHVQTTHHVPSVSWSPSWTPAPNIIPSSSKVL